jgi:hypothetical protein
MALALPVPAGVNTPELVVELVHDAGGQKLRVDVDGRPHTVAFESSPSPFEQLRWLRYYSYTHSEEWTYQGGADVVLPPHGPNLLYVTRHNSHVYDFLKEIVAGLGWRVKFDTGQRTFKLSEVRADEIVDYNLDLLSDSLKRLFFYGAVLKTSETATLVLDEPDVFAFPPYPKTLGEMIGADPTNQFFLTTHNPYFLAGIIEKTPMENLAVFVCRRDAEQGTTAMLLSPDALARVIELGASVFFNLDDFIS